MRDPGIPQIFDCLLLMKGSKQGSKKEDKKKRN
jgi:hypothetical protein